MAHKKSSLTKKTSMFLIIILVAFLSISFLLRAQWLFEDLAGNPYNTMEQMRERTCAAIKTQNYENCYDSGYGHQLSIYTDQCIEEIAITKGDTALCKERGLVNCVWRVAMKKNDAAICEEIIELSQGKEDEYFIRMRDSCVYTLANDESPYANQRYC